MPTSPLRQPLLTLFRVGTSPSAPVIDERGLHDVTLDVLPGEIHALVGPEGAGKSAVVDILAGLLRPTRGLTLVDGVETHLFLPGIATGAGIAAVRPRSELFGNLTVAENVFVGSQPIGRFGQVDRRAMYAKAGGLFRWLGSALDPRRRAGELNQAQRQVVQLARAIATDARAVVLDDPLATLPVGAAYRLPTVLRSLRDDGTAILVCGRTAGDVYAVSDRVTVLRAGRVVRSAPVAELTEAEVEHEAGSPGPNAAVLSVRRLSREGAFADVSFEVRAGEVVALTGLAGQPAAALRQAGHTKVARAVSGLDRYDAGDVVAAGLRGVPAYSRLAEILDGEIADVPVLVVTDEANGPGPGTDSDRAAAHQALTQLASGGVGVLVACARPDDVPPGASRVLVMSDGRLIGEDAR